jgi:hypothetical protein
LKLSEILQIGEDKQSGRGCKSGFLGRNAKKDGEKFGGLEKTAYLCIAFGNQAAA